METRTHRKDSLFSLLGDDYAEATPVPIPNTEVKLCGADNTRRVTAREDRELPGLKIQHRRTECTPMFEFNINAGNLYTLY